MKGSIILLIIHWEGVIKFNYDTIKLINGYPNNIWGWGVEDGALMQRAQTFGIRSSRIVIQNKIKKILTPLAKETFTVNLYGARSFCKVNYMKNEWKHIKGFRYLSRENKVNFIMESGLNNLKYTIIEKKNINDYIELIKVSI